MTVGIPVELVSRAAVEEHGTSGLVIVVFDDSNKIGTDVALHGCLQSCISNPIEDLLEVYKNMIEVLLVLVTFLTEDP